MIRRAAFPALLAILFLLPSLAHAQLDRNPATTGAPQRLFSIRGNLRFEQDEQPAEMVKIELRRFSGDLVGVTFTRMNGEFEFSGLTSGTFIVVVEESGYEPVRQTAQVNNSTVFGVLVYLKKIGAGAQAESGNAVSVRELRLPSESRKSFRKGMDILYKKHDAAASLPVLQKVTIAVPGFYEAFFHMGIAYDQLDKPEEAEAAFRKAIVASEEKYPEAFIALGSLLTSLQKAAEAEPLVRRGVALDASLWQGHYEMGRALAALNRPEEAERSLVEAVRLRKDFPPAYLLLANLHIRMKNQTALLGDLNEFLRLDPNGPQSERARKLRDSIQLAMENSKNAPAAPPKP